MPLYRGDGVKNAQNVFQWERVCDSCGQTEKFTAVGDAEHDMQNAGWINDSATGRNNRWLCRTCNPNTARTPVDAVFYR